MPVETFIETLDPHEFLGSELEDTRLGILPRNTDDTSAQEAADAIAREITRSRSIERERERWAERTKRGSLETAEMAMRIGSGVPNGRKNWEVGVVNFGTSGSPSEKMEIKTGLLLGRNGP